MKKILTILFFCFSSHSFAVNVTYYVSATGDDSHTGLSPLQAWQTIGKVNSVFGTVSPGNSILFNRGDTFYGTITVNKSGASGSPILIGAYGSGAKPVITGFTNISGWTNEGGGIYSKVISSAGQTNMVTIDGVQYAMGRYPDATYLSYESFSTTVSITDNQLTSSPNWTGAEAAIRKNDWTIDRSLITGHTAGTLSYTTLGSTYAGINGFGYFIQNDLRTLTTYGEWYHNPTTGKFYMYFGGVDPTTKVVKVATLNNLVYASGNYDYITLDNINFTGSIDNGLNFQYSQDFITIQNCNISFVGKSGINFLDNCTSDVVNNNNISFCNSYGVYTIGVGIAITNNSITDIGKMPGQSLGNGATYTAISIPGNNSVVRYNTIRRIGDYGVYIRTSGNSTVQYNFIDSACLVLDDGAGIYAPGVNSTGTRLLDHNIITNSIGNSDGTPNNTPISVGVYLDEEATNVTVTNNSIGSMRYSGIKVHRGHDNIITDNTTYDCLYGIDWEDYVGNKIRNTSLRRNILLAKSASQYVINWHTVTNDISLFGTEDSNYYARPIDDNLVFRLYQPSVGLVTKTLTAWKTFSGQGANSNKSPKPISSIGELHFYYNATDAPVTVAFAGLNKMDVTGATFDNAATIPRWGSIILYDNGIASSVNVPPVANAGANQSVYLPTNSVTLTGSGTDSDGIICSYTWTGPDGTIISPGSLTTLITGLSAGVHTFTLAIADDDGAVSFDTVDVTVSDPVIVPCVSCLRLSVILRMH